MDGRSVQLDNFSTRPVSLFIGSIPATGLGRLLDVVGSFAEMRTCTTVVTGKSSKQASANQARDDGAWCLLIQQQLRVNLPRKARVYE